MRFDTYVVGGKGYSDVDKVQEVLSFRDALNELIAEYMGARVPAHPDEMAEAYETLVDEVATARVHRVYIDGCWHYKYVEEVAK